MVTTPKLARAAPADRIELGQVVGVFGLRGWIKVRSYTEPVEALLGYRDWHLELPQGGTSYRLCEGRRQGRQIVARFERIEDRDAAQRLVGARIFIGRGELPRLGAREYYRADLLGFRVLNLQGGELGRVDHFIDTPAHAVMVVRGEQEHLVPVTPAHLRRVDLDAGEVRVDWEPIEQRRGPHDTRAG